MFMPAVFAVKSVVCGPAALARELALWPLGRATYKRESCSAVASETIAALTAQEAVRRLVDATNKGTHTYFSPRPAI